MSAANVALLFAYSLGMSCGQVLFKLAADQVKDAQSFFGTLLTTWYFYAAVALYGALTLLWIWILSRVPLVQAYPFVVLAFVFTPAFGVLLFDESIDATYLVSLALVLGGLGLLVLKGA